MADQKDVNKQAPLSKLSFTALMLGGLSLVPLAGIAFGFLAMIFGLAGIVSTRRHPEYRGRGLAITGFFWGLLGVTAIPILYGFLVEKFLAPILY